MDVIARIHQVKKDASRLASASPMERNSLLSLIAQGLRDDWDAISCANKEDLERAKKKGEAPSLVSRLTFSVEKRDAVIKGIAEVEALPDPIGKVLEKRELDEGMVLTHVSVPLGVIGMVFEARPDALVQIVSLCVKSGNAVILKGGSEAVSTNEALAASIKKSAQKSPVGAAWLLLLRSHEDVSVMLGAKGDIDLVVPRGSNKFVQYVMDHTSIPVLGHSSGICHLYVDKGADIPMAIKIALDAKCQYPAACNAIETLLVHQDTAADFIPRVVQALKKEGVVIHGDGKTCALAEGCLPYRDGDWDKEYLALEINIHVVPSLKDAVSHINEHGSHHTDAIITNDKDAARYFQSQVDSADVFVNCSTRFSDGYRYGLGAELGISTSKIHARGPVGLSGLMSSKWLLDGTGEVVADYVGTHARHFTHKELS